MQICKNIKISALVIFLTCSLLLPAGKILAQGAPALPTDIPVTVPCNDITVGKACGIDIDFDGIDDIEVKNEGLDPLTNKPKLTTRSLKIKSIGGSQFIESPGIANYITAVYKYAVGLVTILTTIMIIISGVMWTTSAGNPESINKAKQMITRSITGLVIALGSYTLLYTINPDLVEFRALQIMRIEKFAAEVPEDYSMSSSTANMGTLSNLADFSGIPNLATAPGVDGRVTAETRMALASAMEQFKGYNSGMVTINSAARTAEKQYNILSRKCGCKPIEILLPELAKNKVTKVIGEQWKSYCDSTLGTSACPASYSTLSLEIISNKATFKAPLIGHFGGYAIDMSSAKTGSHQPCGGLVSSSKETESKGVVNAGKAKGDVCIPKEQQKLIKAMLDNNFCVGLKDGSNLREPWHFELVGAGYNSTFCTRDPNDPNLQKLYYFQNPDKN